MPRLGLLETAEGHGLDVSEISRFKESHGGLALGIPDFSWIPLLMRGTVRVQLSTSISQSVNVSSVSAVEHADWESAKAPEQDK